MIPNDNLGIIMLLGAVVLIVAIVFARLGSRIGLPSLLLFLGLGVVLGDAVLGVQFSNAHLAQALGMSALVVILAEGGMSTRWRDIKPTIGAAGVLATIGIAASVAMLTVFCRYVLGLDLWLSLLLSAVLAPTDAAAVFSVLRNVPIPRRLRGLIEAESGLNDAPTVLLVTVASSLALGGPDTGGPFQLVVLVLVELVGGVILGIGLGWIGVALLRRVALPAAGLYPLAALGWIVLGYGLGSVLEVSGFATVYVTALILGNAQLPHRGATRSFVEGTGWIAQIGLFVMLGLLASPGRLTWHAAVTALIVGAVLTFIARPLSVLLSLLPFRIPLRQQIFVSWAGLRGAVPIVLTTIPMAAGLTSADFLFDVVFIFVILFTVLEAPTLALMAKILKVIDTSAGRDVEIEAAPLDKINAEMLEVTVPEGSKLAGVEIAELRLPKDTVVSLVIRDQQAFTPAAGDRLKVNDEVLIVTAAAQRAGVEDQLRAIGRHGRLARWRGEEERRRQRRHRSTPATRNTD